MLFQLYRNVERFVWEFGDNAQMRLMNRPNHIFLITVDALRADFLGCIGSGTNLTPNIDKLSKRSVVFTRAFANGPGTNQSFPAILSSTYFLMHGGMRLLPGFTTLAQVLSNNSFKTVAFHSNPFLSKGLGWERGFSEFYDFMDVIKSPSAFITRQQDAKLGGRLARLASTFLQAHRSARIQWFLRKTYFRFSRLQIPYLEGKKLNSEVIRWIEKNKKTKFFLWMHYMDPHYPYMPPERYLSDFSSRQEAFSFNLSADHKKPSKDDMEVLKSLYSGEVKYVDACIGEFLRYLEDNGLLENSLILIVADHGHAFMEHDKFSHPYDILYNEVLHIPFILYGLEPSKSVNASVQLLDVPPTITDLLNVKKPPSFMGESLVPLIKGSEHATPLISESATPDLINLRYNTSEKAVSCIVGEWKLIINEMLNSVELYNIEKDFEEKNNVGPTEKTRVGELEQLIRRHLINERLCKTKQVLHSRAQTFSKGSAGKMLLMNLKKSYEAEE